MNLIREVIQKRIKEAFSDGYHNYEKKELEMALEIIEILIPPTEVERCYSGKEVIEMVNSAWLIGHGGNSYKRLEEVISKEYGIKI